MSVTQQYALDLYRAAQRGEPAPPAPGHGDWRALRALREYRDFQTVVAERPARRRRGALRRALRAATARAAQAVRPARRPAAEPPHGAATPRPLTDPSTCRTTA